MLIKVQTVRITSKNCACKLTHITYQKRPKNVIPKMITSLHGLLEFKAARARSGKLKN